MSGEINIQTPKALLKKVFRERLKGETRLEYTKNILKHLQDKYGFTEFMMSLFKETRPMFKSQSEWANSCEKIEGYDDKYLLGIIALIKKQKI